MTYLTWNHCLQSVDSFLDKIFAFAEELDLDVSNLEIDHIGLRVKRKEDVDKLRKEIEKVSEGNTHLVCALVNGRKILTYKLIEPLNYKNINIPCVELPYSSPNKIYPQDGWEHVEFVIPSDAQTIEKFEKIFKKQFSDFDVTKLPEGVYGTDLPKVKGEQLANPTIKLTKYRGLCIKFHPNTIENIVASGR